MEQTKQQKIGLMRYGIIAPFLNGSLENYPSLSAAFRDAAAKGVVGEDGVIRHYAPTTIASWYSDYLKNGFDALLPTGRSDIGKSRKLDTDLQEQIRQLKKAYPKMSAAAIFRQLRDSGIIAHGEISEATVNRYVKTLAIELKLEDNLDMRRYERPHINEVWCGDSCLGMYLKTENGKKNKVYIIALIDDASRFIIGADAFFNDNYANLMSVMKSAIAKYGCPKMFNFDNGSSYRNKQMELLAARIGTVLHYNQPYSPTQKAKIERWFRTMKEQWIACLDTRDFRSLDEIRGSLKSYIHKYNQNPHSSLKDLSPQDRFFSEPDKIRRLTDEQIERAFLLEIERRVSNDCVISIDNIEYEVDPRFSGRRICIRYSPDMKDIFVVESGGGMSRIRFLNKHENAIIKRDKVYLSGGHEL